MLKEDEGFMRLALAAAEEAADSGEVPVGAVLVSQGEVIATGFNQPIRLHDPTAHAEIMALRMASARQKNYRLLHTTLYVTLEPCAMCAMALVHARVKRIVYAASDPRTGACGSVLNIAAYPAFNHQCEVTGGLLAERSATLLQDFFKARR